jgi:diguanylate cyclase (GGDEF)-like protein
VTKYKNKVNDIVDIDKNMITLQDIEFISRDEMSQNEYILKFNEELYSNIFLRLTHRYFTDEVARVFWSNVLKHRDELVIRLKRDPGLIVSCLDYLTNIEHILIDATIIEEGKSQYIITTNLVDDMTSLFIRSVFDVIIKKETDFSCRSKIPLSLMMIDLDDFKKVNDNFGHQMGDNVLSVVGRLILDSVRNMDIACRYGGEELVVIMPNTDLTNSLIIAERIRVKIAEYDFDGFNVTVSIGLSVLDQNDTEVIDLVSLADKALYKAKNSGKNRVVVERITK